MAPHDPRTMPRRFLDMYSPESVPFPENFSGGHPFDNGGLKERDELLAGFPRDPNEVRQQIAEYYAMISHLDWEIGRVLDALEAEGLAENTVIVFGGDNGLALGSHGLMGKQNIYEHSVRVPLVMAGPSIPENETRSHFVYLLDIFPTLCEVAGIAVPAQADGESLLPALTDPAAPGRETLFFAYRHSCRAVKDERFKLIEYAMHGTRVTQLFDLQADPGESVNLAGDPAFSDTLERLRSELKRYRESWEDHLPSLGESFWHYYGRS